ncbi:MAG: adenosylmethionine decarboxylase [Proteobacteria bacterium]|nr:adenosylmethionine decarboxylase [Pseudomonadota bacterium]
MITLGQHYLIEFVGCDADRLSYVEQVEPALLEAVRQSKASYVDHRAHQFAPVGVSLVVMIEESHFSIHTWPEHRFAALDIFTCGEMNAQAAIDHLSAAFAATHTNVRVIARGFDA